MHMFYNTASTKTEALPYLVHRDEQELENSMASAWNSSKLIDKVLDKFDKNFNYNRYNFSGTSADIALKKRSEKTSNLSHNIARTKNQAIPCLVHWDEQEPKLDRILLKS